nr:MAG TPA: hypothetical protein [Caudoviricetes sp.]DAU94656.1 MAG TPA: hypothetical protein [Caudoviricetes sp.]
MQINRTLYDYILLISNLYFTRTIKNPRHCLGLPCVNKFLS